MSASGPNRALRALVGELAELGDSDLEAIMAELEAGERDQLLGLIAEYRKGAERTGETPGSALALSDWLNDRLTGRIRSGMTPAAADALQQAAAERGWRGAATGPAKPAGRPGLLARLGRQP